MTVLSVMLVGMAQLEAPRVSAVVIVRAGGMQMLLQQPGQHQMAARPAAQVVTAPRQETWGPMAALRVMRVGTALRAVQAVSAQVTVPVGDTHLETQQQVLLQLTASFVLLGGTGLAARPVVLAVVNVRVENMRCHLQEQDPQQMTVLSAMLVGTVAKAARPQSAQESAQ
jgi:hypothetical protein